MARKRFAPPHVDYLQPETVEEFKRWLRERGAQVLAPTNPHEVLRFRGSLGVSVLYKRDTGALTWAGETKAAYEAWLNLESWRAGDATKRRRLSVQVKSLRLRDGDDCFYCGETMPVEEMSIEHLVPVTSGGPNHISNLALAHPGCGQRAGSLSVVEKVRLREELRASRRATA